MIDYLRCPELIDLICCCVCFAGNESSDVDSTCCFWPKEQTGNCHTCLRVIHYPRLQNLQGTTRSQLDPLGVLLYTWSWCTCNCCCDLQALLGERGAQGPIWQPGADKYSRLDHQLQNANSQIIEEQQVQQQVQEHLRNLNKFSTFTMPLKCFLSLIADCGAAGWAAGTCVGNHRSPEEHVGANRHGAGWAGRVRTECSKRGGWEHHVTTKCQSGKGDSVN